jgi:uncharacterized protein YkwD
MRALLSIGVLLLTGVSALACERALEASNSASSAAAQPLQPDRALSDSVPNGTVFDARAAQEILRLVNQARAQADLAPLVMDETLSHAAQTHGREMLQHGQLSHQFPGEADLLVRLGQSGVHLSRAGENVAFDYSAAHAHQALMLSDEHRHNLLDPSFNAVGIAVIWSRCQMYVVQDFARELPTYDAGQAEDLIADKVATLRTQTRLPRLNRVKSSNLSEACSSGKAKPNRAAFSNARYVLSYSNAEPQALPPSAGNVIRDSQMRDFSVGACYARTEKNPNGAYFVTMMFY